ncbi:MAG: OadG family protein [Dehalococcoidia bacterium]
MDSGLIDGAVLAGVGLTVVFATLVILMALILLMGGVFGEKGPGPFPPVEGTESVVSEEGEGPPEGEVVAAIALALSLAQSESGRPGPRMGAPPARRTNLWAVYGRQQIMDSRGRARQQW